MDNIKLPAYPLPIARHNSGTLNTTLDVDNTSVGFTKLEVASLMIAQGIMANKNNPGEHWVAKTSVIVAKAVLEECNK